MAANELSLSSSFGFLIIKTLLMSKSFPSAVDLEGEKSRDAKLLVRFDG